MAPLREIPGTMASAWAQPINRAARHPGPLSCAEDAVLRVLHRIPPVIRNPGSYAYGDIEIVGVRGKHAEPYGKEFGQTNTIWLLEVEGLRIIHVGDNGPITDAMVEEIGRVDILMLPIDSLYHILKHDEIEAYRAKLSPQILVPMHYRHPDLEPEPDSPDDLGEIDGWLKEQKNVRRLKSHIWKISRSDLPDTPEILVFEHSPRVKPPS